MLKQFINGPILTPEGWLNEGSVLVEDNKIKTVLNSPLHIVGAEVIDVKGCYIVPGAIDMHIHGGGGRDYMEGSKEAFSVAVESHLKHGTTAIYPTLSSSTVPMILAAAKICQEMMEDENSPVMGLHLEGPYFSLAMAGGQMPKYITAPIPEDYKKILENTNCIKRWDEAPELPGTVEFGKCCVEHGVLPSIGHTQALYKDVKPAYEVGFTHATHFYNAMIGVHKNREFKHEGTIESIYRLKDMTVEVIGDGIHVPPVMMNMIYQLKGVEKMTFITDALACSVSNSNVAFDPRVIIEDGVCKLSDRSALAGSVATMDRVIKTAVQQAEIPLCDVCRMVSETPAKIMKIYDRKGSLEKGKDADLLLLDKDINLKYVMSMGRVVKNEL